MSEQRRCVCPGSYDPVTAGHLDVVRRAAALFDEVVVAVLTNPAKAGTFAPQERIAFLDDALADLIGQGRLRVIQVERRLLVDVCREAGAVAVVKGLRSGTDYGYETPMAVMNRALTGLETVFLAGDPALAHLSSSLVKEVAALGGDVTGMVPDAVRDALVARRG